MKYALGQISGCLDTAWTVLGHVLGQTWLGFWGCPEAARRVLGSNRGEREALLDAAPAFPFDFRDEQIQGETHASLSQSGMGFLHEFGHHISVPSKITFSALSLRTRALSDTPSNPQAPSR